jgi:hypothetical protein
MKTKILIIIILIAATVFATTTVQASLRQDFYLEKVCPSADNPNACDIVVADPPFEHMVEGQVIYFDRVYWDNPAGHTFEIAKVEVTTGNHDGMVIGQVRWLKDHGLFTFNQGSDSLDNLYATGRIDFLGLEPDGRYRFSLTGTYHIDP